MGGGGGGGEAQQAAANAAFWQQQIVDANAIGQQAIQTEQVTRQQLTGTQLDWLRQYGQSAAMKEAGIPAPFSTAGGGFQTPILGIGGNLLSTGNVSSLGKPQPALSGLGLRG
jgi:hypothetical protein